MTKDEYLKWLETVEPADGSCAFSLLYIIAKRYMGDFEGSTVDDCFADYIDEETANKMLRERVAAGDNVKSIQKFLGDIKEYDDYFLLDSDDNLRHITEKYVAATLRNVYEHIKAEDLPERTFTEAEIQDKMMWVAGQALIMKIPPELMKNLMDYANEHPKESVLTSEEFFGFQACPYCGSYEWASGELQNHPEWILPEDKDTDLTRTVGKCTNCCKRFDVDDVEETCYDEYWFVRDYWAKKMEEKFEHIIRTKDLPPILGRFDSNQAVYLDTIFRELALDLLKDNAKWREMGK